MPGPTQNPGKPLIRPFQAPGSAPPPRTGIALTGKPTQVVFSIDGTVVETHAAQIGVSLRPLVSDFNVGGGVLTIDSVEMTP